MKDPFIQTYTGQKFNFCELDPKTVNILDIAHALSMLVRFNGHIIRHYSVAQHSWFAAKVCMETTGDKRLSYITLLHDISEVYLSDLCRPIKTVLPDYIEMENKLLLGLYNCFGVSEEEYKDTKEQVKTFDNIALITEATQLLASPPIDNWITAYPAEPYSEELITLLPHEAKDLFLMKFYQLQS